MMCYDSGMNEYYKNLPRKWMGSGALFFNDKGEILIVKPTYKDGWEIPGGGTEEDESPWTTCIRELKEELGLDISEPKLLSIDYIPNIDDKGDRLMFIYDGGILSPDAISKIVLQKEELSEYRFVNAVEAAELLGDLLKKRVPNSMKAREQGVVMYLENGELVTK